MQLTPDQALERLKAGNADFISGRARSLPTDHDRRAELAHGQAPFAVLLGCSDSRVSPSLLFSVGLGELFTVRNAGNTVDTAAMGSIEYGALVLGASLIVVLGHQRCGAVEAAVQVVKEGATFPGSIGEMIEPIVPAVLAADAVEVRDHQALVSAAVRENVRSTVERLRTEAPSFGELLDEGRLRIVGAEYSLDDGVVDFFLE